MTKEYTKTTTVKMAISVEKRLAGEADDLAHKLGVTRSALYSMALEEFTKRHENRRLLERLNEAYGEGLDPEEKEMLARAKNYHGDRFGADG